MTNIYLLRKNIYRNCYSVQLNNDLQDTTLIHKPVFKDLKTDSTWSSSKLRPVRSISMQKC